MPDLESPADLRPIKPPYGAERYEQDVKDYDRKNVVPIRIPVNEQKVNPIEDPRAGERGQRQTFQRQGPSGDPPPPHRIAGKKNTEGERKNNFRPGQGTVPGQLGMTDLVN